MIYIVTAVHNRKEITEKFIEQINLQTYPDIKLLIVDDGSSDGTSDMIREKRPDAIILKGSGNLYWGGCLHMAYKWLCKNVADDHYVMFANDDTSFDKDYIARAVRHLDESKSRVLITGRGYDIASGRLLDGAALQNFRDIGKSVFLSPNEIGNCASTRSLFFSIRTMKEIGGFHPVILPHYGSDYEWTIRAAKKGIDIISFDDLEYTFDKSNGKKKDSRIRLKKMLKKGSSRNPFYVITYMLLTTEPSDMLPQMIARIRRFKHNVKK